MDGFEGAVVARDMPNPSLELCQKKFLWVDKEVHLAPYPLVGLKFQVREAEKCHQAINGLKSLNLFLGVSQ